MSITSRSEFQGMQRVSDVVASTLREMRGYAEPGMTTLELDRFGGDLLQRAGAKSAPRITYGFPGWTCISVNEEIAHGVPRAGRVLEEGDLINIDVSAELNGFWSDNGGSFVLGKDIHHHASLVDASRQILQLAIAHVRDGFRIAELGRLIESEAQRKGYTVIRNLAGHGIGRKLHEKPHDILNCYDASNRTRFRKNSVVAIETFIATRSTLAKETSDRWTLVGNKGGYVAQHEHTLMVTENDAILFTQANEIWN